MKKNTSYSKKIGENAARAAGMSLPVSAKQAVEICNSLRGRELEQAKRMLKEASLKKTPLPFRRFTEGAGHKPGIGPGKFPVKACRQILSVLESAESNAHQKNLDSSALFIAHICANRGPKTWRYGRQSRVAMKRAHIEIVLEENPEKKDASGQKQKHKKQEKAAEKKQKPLAQSQDQKSKETKKPEAKPAEKEEKKQEPSAQSQDQKNKETKKPEAKPAEKEEKKHKPLAQSQDQKSKETKKPEAKPAEKEKAEKKHEPSSQAKKKEPEIQEKKEADKKPAEDSKPKKSPKGQGPEESKQK